MRQTIFGLLPFFWLLFAVITTESRSINHTVPDDSAEEDFDLENALSDYYDSLMELWTTELKTEEKEEGEEEDKVKPKREEIAGNHPSGLSPNLSNGSEDSTKSFHDLTIPIQIGNITYRLLNESGAAAFERQRANREREGDQGNSTRLHTNDGYSRQTVWDSSQEIKNLRLNSIKNSVMGLRGSNSSQSNNFLGPKETKTLTELFEKQGQGSGAWSASNKYAEKSQSFFPSCEIPKNTDENVWSEPHSMNLYFDVYFPAPQQDSVVMVVNAVLKLYTINQAGSSFVPGNFTGSEFGLHMNQRSENVPNYGLVNDDDKRIRISVYWHTKSLRRQRIKKKLLDSQMLPLNGENTLTFDIRPAVRSWKESGRNFGLQVIVEDENGTLHRPQDYIHPMNCSKFGANVKPLPLFGLDSAAQYFLEDTALVEDVNKSVNEINIGNQDSSFPFRFVKYPILGLQTRDVTLSEVRNLVKLKSIQMELASKYNSINERHQRVSNSQDSSSRITDFENVPLGLPLNQSSTPKPTEDNNVKSVEG